MILRTYSLRKLVKINCYETAEDDSNFFLIAQNSESQMTLTE